MAAKLTMTTPLYAPQAAAARAEFGNRSGLLAQDLVGPISVRGIAAHDR